MWPPSKPGTLLGHIQIAPGEAAADEWAEVGIAHEVATAHRELDEHNAYAAAAVVAAEANVEDDLEGAQGLCGARDRPLAVASRCGPAGGNCAQQPEREVHLGRRSRRGLSAAELGGRRCARVARAPRCPRSPSRARCALATRGCRAGDMPRWRIEPHLARVRGAPERVALEGHREDDDGAELADRDAVARRRRRPGPRRARSTRAARPSPRRRPRRRRARRGGTGGPAGAGGRGNGGRATTRSSPAVGVIHGRRRDRPARGPQRRLDASKAEGERRRPGGVFISCGGRVSNGRATDGLAGSQAPLSRFYGHPRPAAPGSPTEKPKWRTAPTFSHLHESPAQSASPARRYFAIARTAPSGWGACGDPRSPVVTRFRASGSADQTSGRQLPDGLRPDGSSKSSGRKGRRDRQLARQAAQAVGLQPPPRRAIPGGGQGRVPRAGHVECGRPLERRPLLAREERRAGRPLTTTRPTGSPSSRGGRQLDRLGRRHLFGQRHEDDRARRRRP